MEIEMSNTGPFGTMWGTEDPNSGSVAMFRANEITPQDAMFAEGAD